jgi:hypothetical protein
MHISTSATATLASGTIQAVLGMMTVGFKMLVMDGATTLLFSLLHNVGTSASVYFFRAFVMNFMTMLVVISSAASFAMFAVMLHGMALYMSMNVMFVVTVVHFMT